EHARGCGRRAEVAHLDGVTFLATAYALVEIDYLVAGDRAGRAIKDDAAQPVCPIIASIGIKIIRRDAHVADVCRRAAVLDDAADEVAGERIDGRDRVPCTVE